MSIDITAERDKLLRAKITEDRKTGAQFRTLRKRKQLKASWVADRMGITKGYLSDLENGNRHWNPVLEATFRKAIA